GLNSAGVPQAGSAAIGAGANLTSLCTGNLVPLCSDIAGNPRPSTGAWDAGAYESTTTSQSTANLWVDTNGGTCTRQSAAGAYNDAQACSSMSAAFSAASAGDKVVIKCGSYGSQTLSGSAKSSAVSFYGETYDQPTTAAGVVAATTCATVASLTFSTSHI